MTERRRFSALMSYQPFDRLPVYYFGTWAETMDRWVTEGLSSPRAVVTETHLDGDWESGMWRAHGLSDPRPMSDESDVVLEETDDYQIVRTALGAVLKQVKPISSIPQHIKEALLPDRKSWRQFKRFLDPDDPRRRSTDWEAQAEQLNARENLTVFLGGSLFGWPRDWMGLETISYLSYDDPALYEEIIEYLTEYFIRLHGPMLDRTRPDLAYLFEDCCGRSGPLFSPRTYEKFYAKYYRRLTDFYHTHGVQFIMLDSDGDVEQLIPHWLDSGIDIIFPIEVGTWRADPVTLRKKFGKRLRMFGGVDKHVIPAGEKAIRDHLAPLRPLAAEGGYIPIPDHRIPPSCSLAQFKTYVRIFKDVFADL